MMQDTLLTRLIYMLHINAFKNSCHSHSIVNETFVLFHINNLFFCSKENAMKNTMLRKSFKMLKKIAD